MTFDERLWRLSTRHPVGRYEEVPAPQARAVMSAAR
jgi:hypothetical protein